MRFKTLLLATISVALLLGQSQTSLQNAPAAAAPEFEVASIKPDTSGDMGMSVNMQGSGAFRASGVPLKLILEEAYRVKDAQLIGAPNWVSSDKFVIDAKPDEATSAQLQKMEPEQRSAEMMHMLQGLLAERCQLKLRKETRDLPVYILLVGRTGIKFHQSPPSSDDAAPPAPGPNNNKMRHGIRTGRGDMEASDIEMHTLADALSNHLGRPVLDKTGLSGTYDFAMKWAPEEHDGEMFEGASSSGAAAPTPPSAPAGPSIFTAIQEQLGLKLEAQKSAMTVLVIDHIEKPSAN